MLCAAKVGANPESTVGLLSMAGRNARFLVTSTRDMGIVFSCIHDVKCNGSTNIIAAMQKAQLALKHRQNAVQRQRIVVFVSSPIEDSTERMVQVGKKMKKNNVAVDIVNLGSEADNEAKINAFIEAVNANDNSHALHIPSGGPNVSDTFLSSEVYVDRDAQPAGGTSGGGGDAGGNSEFPFGVDPAQDPELAMVLRISMEDERLRQEQVAREQAEAAASGEGAGDGAAGAAAAGAGDGEYGDDDDLYTGGKDKMDVEGAPAAAAGTSAAAGQDDEMEDEMDEETRRAIALSMTDFEAPKDDGKDKN